MDFARKISRCLFDGKVEIDRIDNVMKISKEDLEAAGLKNLPEKEQERVTFKELLEKPKKLKDPKVVCLIGIKRAETNVMTAPEAVAIIKENHKKKEDRKKKIDKKKEIEKKAVKTAQVERRLRLRPRKTNPKL